MAKRFLLHLNSRLNHINNENLNPYSRILSGVINRYLSETPKSEKDEQTLNRDGKSSVLFKSKRNEENSDENDDELTVWKWKFESDWLSKALEPALQLYKWASFTKTDENHKIAPNSRSFSEILANLQRSKITIQDWSLSDFTVGLYLIYLSQASSNKTEEFNGVQITSEPIVKELIYNLELAKGCYKDSPSSLAKHSMLREKNILKFIKDSSVMRPGFYLATDPRARLVVLGIRGTHTVYDIITDLVASSDPNGSTHFGTDEAARWFLENEMGIIRRLLEKHKGYKLRLVGHSLGGAAAALLAIMLRNKSEEELGFPPEIISAVGFGTPPCVSKRVAESCASFVSTVVLQDDIIPRLSAASLARLRNEIIETDWMTILEKEDWKAVIDIVTNAKLVVSSIQDVARKLAEIAKFNDISHNHTDTDTSPKPYSLPQKSKLPPKSLSPQELVSPGSLFFLKRQIQDLKSCKTQIQDLNSLKTQIQDLNSLKTQIQDLKSGKTQIQDLKSGKGEIQELKSGKSAEEFTLWRRDPGLHFSRISLSGNLIADHRCDSHYYALRDVLKGIERGESGDCTGLL